MDSRKHVFETSKRGIYAIIDPKMDEASVIDKLRIVLSYHILAVQIWDNGIENCLFLHKVIRLCKEYNTPLLINNKWELLHSMDFDGVHFDKIPADWEQIKAQLKNKLLGITCNNDLRIIEWAEAQKFDYISFCSMFASTNNTHCDLVAFDTVHKARQMTAIPFILTGGITLDNIDVLAQFDYQGVAMISELNEDKTLNTKINTIYTKLNNG